MKNYHEDHTQQVFDARNQPYPDVVASCVYYLVYRVRIGNATWFHHALLLADDIDEFLAGSSNLQAQIRDSLHKAAIISLMFVRSLHSEDKVIIESALSQEIYKDIADCLSSGRETNDNFMVFGLIGDDQSGFRMALMNLARTDAWSAIKSVHTHVRNNMREPFTPLDVCLVHPVTHEFLAHYEAKASLIRTISGEPAKAGQTIH